jgi:hypothetical protein
MLPHRLIQISVNQECLCKMQWLLVHNLETVLPWTTTPIAFPVTDFGSSVKTSIHLYQWVLWLIKTDLMSLPLACASTDLQSNKSSYNSLSYTCRTSRTARLTISTLSPSWTVNCSELIQPVYSVHNLEFFSESCFRITPLTGTFLVWHT